jgi:phosphatidylinositol alpha-1,6-mannosyltransferase
MNVVVVGFNFSLIGGLEIVSKAIAAAAATRHAVTCVSLQEAGRKWESGYEIIGLASSSKVMRSLRFRFPLLFQPRDIRQHFAKADVVVFAHAHTLRTAMPVLAEMERRPVTVCWLHGREVWGEMGRKCVPLLSKCDHLVSVSHYTADNVASMMPGHLRPEVIHNPVDTELFKPVDSATGETVRRNAILTVGRHDADSFHKGYDVLIEAMALLRDRRPDLPLQLTITGAGELLARHRDQIGSLALEDRVLLAGKVPRSELIRLYRTTDAFAFPSRLVDREGEQYGEGFGVVNVEAAAAGRPVITSTHGGCPETVIDGVTGFTVDPTSPLAAAAAIEKIFAMSPGARDEMGRRGRQMAVERFSSICFRDRVNQVLATACPLPEQQSHNSPRRPKP